MRYDARMNGDSRKSHFLTRPMERIMWRAGTGSPRVCGCIDCAQVPGIGGMTVSYPALRAAIAIRSRSQGASSSITMLDIAAPCVKPGNAVRSREVRRAEAGRYARIWAGLPADGRRTPHMRVHLCRTDGVVAYPLVAAPARVREPGDGSAGARCRAVVMPPSRRYTCICAMLPRWAGNARRLCRPARRDQETAS